MDRSIYLAMSGAQQTLVAQAANAHNLANVSTAGFRADLTQFRSMPVFGDTFNSRAFALPERPGVNLDPGALESTGRSMDVAINDKGWIAVQAADGTEAYTRAGDLQISGVGGVLETGAGHPVMGDGGPIVLPPFDKLEVGSDGTISIVPAGATVDTLAVVDRIKLVNPPADFLEKGTDGLIRQADGLPAPADADVSLLSGVVESSNVNMVGALVEMITLARRFEAQVKMMNTADENEAQTSSLMQLS